MHERSLVATLLKQVTKVCLEHPGSQPIEVRVAIGPLSGVEPELLHSAFYDFVASNYQFSMDLVIDRVPLFATCKECGQRIAIEELNFRCSLCNSRDIRIISGDTLELISVTLTQPQPIETNP